VAFYTSPLPKYIRRSFTMVLPKDCHVQFSFLYERKQISALSFVLSGYFGNHVFDISFSRAGKPVYTVGFSLWESSPVLFCTAFLCHSYTAIDHTTPSGNSLVPDGLCHRNFWKTIGNGKWLTTL